jgi:hypothetical protein
MANGAAAGKNARPGRGFIGNGRERNGGSHREQYRRDGAAGSTSDQ